MAVVTRANKSGLVPYRVTAKQFVKMIEAGIFPEGDRVELLGGLLVDMMTKYEPHDFAVDMLAERFRGWLPVGWIVREEKAMQLGANWRPEPDVIVARGPRQNYRHQSPRAADLALVVEVADSSYPKDRGIKWRRYGQTGVPCYWLLSIHGRTLEVFTDPFAQGYRTAVTFDQKSFVPFVIEGRELGRVAVADLLP